MTALVFARGVDRQIAVAVESDFGVQGAGPGQLLRRTTFTMDPNPPEITSQEIRPDSQVVSAQLGVRSLGAQLSGELSPGSYKMFFEGLSRGTWTSGVTTGALSDTALTIDGTTKVLTLNSAANFLTDGFKVGDVCRLSGLTSSPAALNGVNLRATSVISGQMTFQPNTAAAAWGSGQGAVTLVVAGKKLFTPAHSSQVYRSYSIESWNPAASESQMGLGLRVASIGLNMSPNGFVGFQASLAGSHDVYGSSQQYASATDALTSQGIVSSTGRISYQGSDIGYITGFNVQFQQALEPVPVTGALYVPDIVPGMITARGSLSALLTNDTFTTDFFQENDVSINFYLPNTPAGNSDFVSIFLPRIRLLSNTRTDGDRAIRRSFNFQPILKVGGSGTEYDQTTFVLQDSLA